MPPYRPHPSSTFSTSSIFTAAEQRFVELIMRTADLEKMTKCFDWNRMHALSGNTSDRVVHDSWSRLKMKLGVNRSALSSGVSKSNTRSKLAKSKKHGHGERERDRNGSAGGSGEGEEIYDPIRRELRRQLMEGFDEEEMSEWSDDEDDDDEDEKEASSSSPPAFSTPSEYDKTIQNQHRNKRQKHHPFPSLVVTKFKQKTMEYNDERLKEKGKGKRKGKGETMKDMAMPLTRRGHEFIATGGGGTTRGSQPQPPTRVHGGNRYHNYLPNPTRNIIGKPQHHHHHRHQLQHQHQPAIVDGWDLLTPLTPLKPFSPTPVSPTPPKRRHIGSSGLGVRVKQQPYDFGDIGPEVVEVVMTREGREVEIGSRRDVAVDVDSW